MRRGGPLKRRQPWNYKVKPIRRETPLSPESAKGRARRLAFKDVRLYVLDRDHYTCRAGIPGQCQLAAGDVHHVRNRSQGGKDDPDNLVSLCRPCHAYLTEHPRVSAQLGWTIQNVDRS